jgi:hypothetical protein
MSEADFWKRVLLSLAVVRDRPIASAAAAGSAGGDGLLDPFQRLLQKEGTLSHSCTCIHTSVGVIAADYACMCV